MMITIKDACNAYDKIIIIIRWIKITFIMSNVLTIKRSISSQNYFPTIQRFIINSAEHEDIINI